MLTICDCRVLPLQWGAADAEIKVPSGENTELKCSPFKAWSRSVYDHTCYAYCQGFLPCFSLPFRSIHQHFFQNLSRFFPVLAVANTGSCVGSQNKTGHPAGCRFPCWVPAEYEWAQKTWFVVWWLVKWISWRQSEVCVQPWCNPLWLTGLKAPTNKTPKGQWLSVIDNSLATRSSARIN